ncbi:hypothetical protein NA57DRAFT_80647 [Rhizodiscina lignyota]|uniref:CENP-V/GFA domain-containing protein n=1 Tax=Rhizodiscina lignyota TaxID=1504668 RepID=A0A9P4I688_9PEZI|nr:hypothetical protein NA57DRAFT_80647 [Rhizodiscina lignyota]
MPTGSCLCGNIRISYDGDATMKGICHCNDCRRLPGFGLVFGIPEQDFKITHGEPKVFIKVADSGRDIHTYFCDNCGTQLWRTNNMPEMKGLVMLRAPVIDQVEEIDGEKGKPTVEIYAERRPAWKAPVEGAAQMNSRWEPIEA